MKKISILIGFVVLLLEANCPPSGTLRDVHQGSCAPSERFPPRVSIQHGWYDKTHPKHYLKTGKRPSGIDIGLRGGSYQVKEKLEDEWIDLCDWHYGPTCNVSIFISYEDIGNGDPTNRWHGIARTPSLFIRLKPE